MPLQPLPSGCSTRWGTVASRLRLALHAGIPRFSAVHIVSDLPDQNPADQVLQLHAERLDVRRRVRQTGEVRISVQTRTRDQQVDEQLTRRDARIEHVPVNRYVDEMPQVRQEGDTTVIPVVEEILVRRLFLKEEVRVTRTDTTRNHHETVSLRYQDVVISRTGSTGTADGVVDNTLPTQGDLHG